MVLAYDSMEVFPLVAAAIMSFRKDNLMVIELIKYLTKIFLWKKNSHENIYKIYFQMVSSYTNMEAVLSDLSSLPVVPLMQLALERSRIHRLNSNVGNK